MDLRALLSRFTSLFQGAPTVEPVAAAPVATGPVVDPAVAPARPRTTVQSRTTPGRDAYDVVVVGSGLGGLSAGALLARAGQKVLVVERAAGPGGYARAVRRGPYLIDPAVHVTAHGAEGQPIDAMLRFLGVVDRCTLVRVDELYHARFPDFTIRVPTGAEAFVEAHARQFPDQAQAIRQLVELSAQVFREAHQVTMQLSIQSMDEAIERFPALFRYRMATVAEVLEELISDPRCRAACAAIWPYTGLPPSRASFLFFAQALTNVLQGVYTCLGSFQQLVDAFVAGLERHGGELVLGTAISKIVVEDGRVAGVLTAGGQRIAAPVVISNADARQTIEGLVGIEQVSKGFARRLDRLRPSLSACVVAAATELDLRAFDPAHQTLVYRHWDHEQTYADILAGQPGGMSISVPTLADPSLAPAGQHLLTITALAPYELGASWEEAAPRYREALLGEVESVFPGFRERLAFDECYTPATFQQTTLNYHGAAYGWENAPDQMATRRLGYQTPVNGLFLSGHWTQPGGSFRVIVSGMHVARMVAAAASLGEAIPHFEPPEP
jgi:prolycopene isomerase